MGCILLEITTDCAEGRTDSLEQGYWWDSWHLILTLMLLTQKYQSMLSKTCR